MSAALIALCGITAARPTVATFLHTLLATGSSTRATCAALTTLTTRSTR